MEAKEISFTDKQLERLKHCVNTHPHAIWACDLPYPDWQALLMRLEAAEQALWSSRFSDSVMEQEADYKVWKKAAGK